MGKLNKTWAMATNLKQTSAEGSVEFFHRLKLAFTETKFN